MIRAYIVDDEPPAVKRPVRLLEETAAWKSPGNSLRFVVLFLVLVVGLSAGTVTVNLNPPSMPVSAGQMLSTEVDLAGLGTLRPSALT
jgi:hypothetical protein